MNQQRFLVCPDCDTQQVLVALPSGCKGRCCQCDRLLISNSGISVNVPLALALAAFIFLLLANYFPIVSFSVHGNTNQAIIWQGVVGLFKGGLPLVGLLVLLAGIVFPLTGLASMIFVLVCYWSGSYPPCFRVIMRIYECLIRWAMMDVYVLACLVAFNKLGQLARVEFGEGFYCLAAALLGSLFASMAIEPDKLWSNYYRCLKK